MADEPENLILRLLQEIRRDVADVKAAQSGHTADLASIKEMLRLHGERLNVHSENFATIIGLLRDRATAADLRALEARVSALENRRQ
jgi:hypothetical protein